MSSRTYTVHNEDTSAAFTTDAVNLQNQSKIAVQGAWDGTLAGTLTLEVSLDGITWNASSITLTNPAGSPGDFIVQGLDYASLFRVDLASVTGSGNLKVVIHGK